MKRNLLIILSLLLLASCATTKVSKKTTPVGDWDYSITGTPMGDFNGIMTVNQQDNNYSAKLSTNGEAMPFEKFAWDSSTKTVTGELNYSGTPVYFTAILNGTEMTGAMSAGGGEFPFKAVRKSAK